MQDKVVGDVLVHGVRVLDRIAVVAGADQHHAAAGRPAVHLVGRGQVLNDGQVGRVGRRASKSQNGVARDLKRDLEAEAVGQRPRPGPDGRDDVGRVEFAVLRAHAGYPAARFDQARHGAIAFHHRALGARGVYETGCRQVGVGIARVGLVADDRRILQVEQRVAVSRVLARDHEGLRPHVRLHGKFAAQLVGEIPFGRNDEVARVDEAGVRLRLFQPVRETVKHLQAAQGKGGVARHRIVAAHDGAGLRRAAAADRAAIHDADLQVAQLGQVERGRGADHAGADDDGIVGFGHCLSELPVPSDGATIGPGAAANKGAWTRPCFTLATCRIAASGGRLGATAEVPAHSYCAALRHPESAWHAEPKELVFSKLCYK